MLERPVDELTFEPEGFPALTFRSASPEGFEWERLNVGRDDFKAAEIFPVFREVLTGRHSDERRAEIHVYAAEIDLKRVGLGIDYARLLAAVWAPSNGDAVSHSAVFGEALGTSEATEPGLRMRISVFRRGKALLIVRAEAEEDDWSGFETEIATFVGSISFVEPAAEDPALQGAKTVRLDAPAEGGEIDTLEIVFPAHWRDLNLSAPALDGKGDIRFLVDDADPLENTGVMPFSFRLAEGRVPHGVEDGGRLASVLVEVLLTNMLPGREPGLKPLAGGRYADLGDLTDFTGYYTFKVTIKDFPRASAASALVTVNKDRIVGFASISAYPEDLSLWGARLHVNYVKHQLEKAIRDYWERSAQSTSR